MIKKFSAALLYGVGLILAAGALAGVFAPAPGAGAAEEASRTDETIKLAQRAGKGKKGKAGGKFGKRGRKGGKRLPPYEGPPKGTIRVTLLGTGGGPGGGGGPDGLFARMGANTLVEANGQVLIFDAGRGLVLRLGELGRIYLNRADKLFLTHLHSDHISDIPDLFTTGWTQTRRQNLSVWGPAGTKAMMTAVDRFFDWDFSYRVNPRRTRGTIDAHDSVQGVVFEKDGVKVTAFDVDHWPPRHSADSRKEFPAFGYRVDYNGRSVAVSGDTRFSENLIEFTKGVDMLIHEVHVTRRAGDRFPGGHHTGPDEAGVVFERTKPKLAVYSHIVWGRGGTPDDLERVTREKYKGPLVIGEDRMRFLISDDVKRIESVGAK